MTTPESYGLCTADDEYVRHLARWIVTLSDGTTVYQDDDRPGIEPPSAWVRLRRYCEEQGRWVVRMRFHFRSNGFDLPPDRDGYFFVRTANGVDGGWNFGGVRVGHVEGDRVFTAHYQIPALIYMDEDVRPLDRESPCVIVKPAQ